MRGVVGESIEGERVEGVEGRRKDERGQCRERLEKVKGRRRVQEKGREKELTIILDYDLLPYFLKFLKIHQLDY